VVCSDEAPLGGPRGLGIHFCGLAHVGLGRLLPDTAPGGFFVCKETDWKFCKVLAARIFILLLRLLLVSDSSGSDLPYVCAKTDTLV